MDNKNSLVNFLSSRDVDFEKEVNSNSMLKSLAKEMYMKKLQEEDRPLYDASLEIVPALAGVTSKVLNKAIPKDPYFTVYHGTSPKNKQSIVDNGIRTEFTGKENTLTDKALQGTNANELSKGLAFTTTSKWDAARYAASHDPKTGTRIDSSSPVLDQIKKLGRQVNSYATDKGIVTMTLPNSAYKAEVLNPEVATLLSKVSNKEIPDKYKAMQDLPLGLSGIANPYVAAAGFGKDKVFNVDIPSKYVKGSKDYAVPASKEYIPYQETLVAKDSLASKLYDADRKLDLTKRVATHSAVNNALRYAGEVEK